MKQIQRYDGVRQIGWGNIVFMILFGGMVKVSCSLYFEMNTNKLVWKYSLPLQKVCRCPCFFLKTLFCRVFWMIHPITRHYLFLAKNFSFPQENKELCQSCSGELLCQKSRESQVRTPDVQRNSNRTKTLETNRNSSAMRTEELSYHMRHYSTVFLKHFLARTHFKCPKKYWRRIVSF